MVRFAFALALALAGCGGLPKPPVAASASCGNPCASLSCPSAFFCDVDGQCRASCKPEPVPVTR